MQVAVFCFTVLLILYKVQCEDELGPSNPVVKKLFGVQSAGTLVLPTHKRVKRNTGYSSNNNYMVSCNSCSSCPGCSTNVVVTYPGNNGCSQGNCNTGTYYPQQKNGCNQGNCNTQQQQNVIINVCNWQYQCYTKNVCNSCGNSNQYKVCQWKCTNYCQSYFCG